MAYPHALKYLESFVNYEKINFWPYKESMKLERLRDFLSAINNPQGALKCIHVAGTKGKGSTSAFIAYILREAGYRTGLYTSPHLADFRERIRILNPKSKIPPQKLADSPINVASPNPNGEFEGMISKKELSGLVDRIRPYIEKYGKNSKCGPLSFFEVYTALAFIYFKEKKVDFVVLETGLGGRLDSTNAANSLVAVITPISYEHTQKLGNTLTEIAAEKAGIIKVHSSKFIVHSPIVISAPQEKEALAVIRNRAKETGAKLYEVGKDIIYSHQVTKSPSHQILRIKGLHNDYPNLRIKLLGRHQLINAACAVGAVEALRSYGIKVGVNSVRRGLYSTRWPARCEVLSLKPAVVLDGAQNVASAKAVKNAVKENFRYKKLILVLGVSQDKDIKGICGQFYGFADKIILTKADTPRSTAPEMLAGYFSGRDTYLTYSVREAYCLARDLAGKEDLILVCGSLFVAGEFRYAKA